jgi:acyl carrier protein
MDYTHDETAVAAIDRDNPESDGALIEVTAIVRSVCDDPTIRLTRATATDSIPDWQGISRAGIVVEAECRYDVMFQAQEVLALRSVGDLIDLIARKRGRPDG